MADFKHQVDTAVLLSLGLPGSAVGLVRIPDKIPDIGVEVVGALSDVVHDKNEVTRMLISDFICGEEVRGMLKFEKDRTQTLKTPCMLPRAKNRTCAKLTITFFAMKYLILKFSKHFAW